MTQRISACIGISAHDAGKSFTASTRLGQMSSAQTVSGSIYSVSSKGGEENDPCLGVEG